MSRRKGRIIAFQALYSWDVSKSSLDDLLSFSWLQKDAEIEAGTENVVEPVELSGTAKGERTLASLMNDDVPKKIKKERVNSLIKLGAENLQNIYKKMDMTTQNILIEHNNVAHAENFVKIETDDTFNNKIGEIVKTKVVYRNNKLIALT